MTKTTTIVSFLYVLILASCSSATEQIENEMAAYIKERFPAAEYTIIRQGNDYELTISSSNNISKSDLDRIMATTLGEFYRSFHETSNQVSTNSRLTVTLVADTNSWTTRKYDLFELGEMYPERIKTTTPK